MSREKLLKIIDNSQRKSLLEIEKEKGYLPAFLLGGRPEKKSKT